MEIIFCSSVYNMNDYDSQCMKSKISLSLADHNLNYNIILGLDEALAKPVSLVNNVQIPSYPNYPKIIFRRQKWHHTYSAKDQNCGFINLPLVKQFSRANTTYRALKKWIEKTGQENIYVITYDLHVGISSAIHKAKKKYPLIHTCAILPDIPSEMLTIANNGTNSKKNKSIALFKMKFIQMFDSYVFLTEFMKNIVNVSNKPYVVVEGIYNYSQLEKSCPPNYKKIIFYSGLLNPAYGIENLIKAFLQIYKKYQNYELWICGSGELEEKIRSIASECPAIHYYGYVNAATIQKYQSEATVLVNPRQNNGEYTKYSFPSKTMEYLASGNPVIGYKLDGIPQEYDSFIQYVNGNSIADLRDKLIEICSLSKEQREKIGNLSKEFIINKKNPKIQAQRIIDMFEKSTHAR